MQGLNQIADMRVLCKLRSATHACFRFFALTMLRASQPGCIYPLQQVFVAQDCILLFYPRGHRGTERLSDLPGVTQLTGGRARTYSQVCPCTVPDCWPHR